MRVCLVRHARPQNTSGDDAPLSEEGILQAKRLGKLFDRLQLDPVKLKIVSSAIPRARETTKLLCQEMGIADEATTFPGPIDGLPGVDLKDRLMKRLRQIAADENPTDVIVVGHQPYLGKSLAWLLGSDVVTLPNGYGATVCLTCAPGFEQGAGNLEWLVLPELLP